ncbi:MAG: hypothetical protein IM577_07995 [Chitinophagaceae bacterium]|nr:hypothetical protein [Chitinophagaceae bacterium]
MNTLKILGYTKDYRTNTNVLYCQISITEYFDFVRENYNKFQLQRKKETHKGYKRLKEDLKHGALIPSITLAIEPSKTEKLIPLVESENNEQVIKTLNEYKDEIYILDGLQRSHKIKELLEAGVKFQTEQNLLLEIWIEPEISNLVYRLIVLNSGQKPMSMRHQIELLFTTMRITLMKEIEGLEILPENEEEKRTISKQFPFDRLVTAYYSFLTNSPEVDKSSIVSQKLVEEKIMDDSEEYLSESFNSFKEYLNTYCSLDQELFRIYSNGEYKNYRNWFAEANTINSFFASVGKLNESKSQRVKTALQKLHSTLIQAAIGTDPLQLYEYRKIREEVADPKKYNVGFATRRLLSMSFDEYFRDEGDRSLHECWIESSNNFS